jgi:hypothetical protein
LRSRKALNFNNKKNRIEILSAFPRSFIDLSTFKDKGIYYKVFTIKIKKKNKLQTFFNAFIKFTLNKLKSRITEPAVIAQMHISQSYHYTKVIFFLKKKIEFKKLSFNAF